VARQTRNQRRKAAARQQEQRAEGSVSQRARSRQAQVRPSAQPTKTQTGGRRVPGGGFRRFVAECWGELKKVEWPNQRQVFQGTVVVIVACAIVGAYLYVADLAIKPLVQQILTGQ
jgi:preprotein translocase SecE subunit